MKRTVLFVVMVVILLTSVLNFVYAENFIMQENAIKIRDDEILVSGIFEDIGSAIGESFDNVVTIVGNTLKELISYTVNKFKDVKVSDWFVDTVSKLVGRGGIDGYPDGTFKPNNTITKAEFTKLLVSVLGYENTPKTNSHWASGYISKAEQIKLIDIDELVNIDSTISRNEMAKMCARALDYLGESHVQDRSLYSTQITDFSKIPATYQDYVLKAYTKGLITGYPDGTFGGDRGLTRAEASTVIIRILEIEERILPAKPTEPIIEKPTIKLSEKDIKRLQNYPLNPIYYLDAGDVVKDYKGFEEYYREQTKDCELIYKEQLWTPINYPPTELKGKTTSNLKWFSSPKLIYDALGTYGIRGVLQKTENGKTYEADFEIMIRNTMDGTYLLDDKWGEDFSGRLSEWKEVK